MKSALELADVMELLACAGFAAGVDNLTDDHLARLRTRFTQYCEHGLENPWAQVGSNHRPSLEGAVSPSRHVAYRSLKSQLAAMTV
jgi:hypothetical protein